MRSGVRISPGAPSLAGMALPVEIAFELCSDGRAISRSHPAEPLRSGSPPAASTYIYLSANAVLGLWTQSQYGIDSDPALKRRVHGNDERKPVHYQACQHERQQSSELAHPERHGGIDHDPNGNCGCGIADGIAD